jgi:peptide/nickel transport system substrate-binding protein
MTHTVTIALEKLDFFPANRVTDDTSILTLKNLVFEPLCGWADGFARPALFARWEHSADGREWLFHLRDGAAFHDGAACTVQHVLDFIDGILQSVDTFGMKWSYARYLADAQFTAVTPTCLKLTNPEPIADILDLFSEFYICRTAPDGSATLGTGPYRVAAWDPRVVALLERVTVGTGDGAGPERILVRACADADERYRMLKDGDIDLAHNLERMHGQIDFDPAWQWQRQLNTLSVMSYLNASEGLFTSAAARLAINHAVDAQAIVNELFQGLGQASSTIVSPFHLGHKAAGIAPIPYAPDTARKLFDSVDFSGELVLRTPEYMPEKSLEITRMVQQALADVGVRSRLDVQTDRPEYAREIGRKQMGDVAIFDSSPHSTYRILNDKISSATQAVWWQGHNDAQLEQLIVAANHSVADGAREAAYGRCLQRLNVNPPWLYLFHPVEIYAARHDLAGFSLNHKGVLVVTQ